MKSWPTKKLGEVLEKNGVIPAKIKRGDYWQSGKYPVVDQGENLIAGYINDEQKLYRGDLPVIVFGDHTRILKYIDFPFAFGADGIKILRPKDILLPKFFYYILVFNPIENQGYKRHFSLLAHTKILIPSLAIQKQIIERLDKIAEAQKLNGDLVQKTDELFQSLLHRELNPAGKNWEVKKIKDVATVKNGGTPSTKNQRYWNGKILWLTPKELSGFEDIEISDTERKISDEGLKHSSATLLPAGTVLLTSRAPIGYITIAGVSMATNQGFKNFICDSKLLNNKFLYFFLRLKIKYLQSLGRGATFTEISKTAVEKINISLPPLEIQKQIVTKLSAVQDYKKQLLEQKSKLKELFDSALAKSLT